MQPENKELRLLWIKYPEYQDWFWNSEPTLHAIAQDLWEAGHKGDSERLTNLIETIYGGEG